ncbi:Membrane protein involved in the export of O-antigen and teichoic acid (RfbX) [Fructobacillus cardui]|uniref:lipopolysaccharide biosynthesis protein n=1 Tax=Fructobacillus cardui TaxID=2893170 RepID=UPI002D97425C|nr:Membrane protein involved in the export of O-antigen and teichoic acid (RfbX) [Fructobacillus cardui]
MDSKRKHYAIINVGTSGLSTAFKFILGFLSRTIFIHILGSEILGLNGLLTSTLTTLSLAEMGIGSAVVYSLYEPLANKRWTIVQSIMRLYRNIYRILALLILAIGLAIVPFLPLITGKQVEHSTFYYLILLTNSVVSYLLTYNRSLLIANERNYIVSFVDFLTYFVMTVLQVIILFVFKNYALYLIIQVISTLAGNIGLSIYVKKQYDKYFVSEKIVKVPRKIINKLKRNVIGTFASRIGDIVVNGTDNILIAAFINLSTVGLYSNYQLIISAIQQILYSVSTALTATIGNIAVGQTSKDEGADLFFRHQFANYTITFFVSALLLGELPTFIRLWIGSSFLLPDYVDVLMVGIFVINILRYSGLSFIDAYGLSYEQRAKPILEAIFNLLFSILFLKVFDLGILGILLATMITSLFIATVYEAYVVFYYGFNRSVLQFYKKYIKMLVDISINLVLVSFLTSFSSSFLENLIGRNYFLILIVNFVSIILLSIIVYCFLNMKRIINKKVFRRV